MNAFFIPLNGGFNFAKIRGFKVTDYKRVYTICLMDFTFESNPKLRRDVQLCDIDEQEVFSDKLNIILLQLPCLKAESLGECNANYEFLLYLLKEMQKGMKTIEQLKQEVAATKLPQETKELFYKVLDTADISTLSEKDQLRYESDLKNYMDTMSCIEFAEIKGKTEGRAEEKTAIAKSLKQSGMELQEISKHTGLTAAEIEAL